MEKQQKIRLLFIILGVLFIGGFGYGWKVYQDKRGVESVVTDPFAGVEVPAGLDDATRAVYEEKIQLTKEMYQKQPEIWETWIAIGNLKSLLKDQDGALAAYQHSVALQPNNLVGERNIAALYSEHFHDYERAAIHYRAAIRNEVNNVELYTNLIMIEWKQLNDLASAESTLQTGLLKTRYHYDMVRLAGEYYRGTGNITKAEEYEKAWAKMPRPSGPTPAILGVPTK